MVGLIGLPLAVVGIVGFRRLGRQIRRRTSCRPRLGDLRRPAIAMGPKQTPSEGPRLP